MSEAGRPRRTREAVVRLLTWAAAAAAILLALLWARQLSTLSLWACVVATTLAAVLVVATRAPASRWLLGAVIAVAFAAAFALRAEREFARIEFDWDRVVAEREQQLSSRLEDLITELTARGRRAAELAAEAVAEDRTAAFERLATIRERTGVDALAVFGPGGAAPLAWAGDHRGTIPDPVRRGERAAFFAERPLYSYLYFTAPVKGGPAAVAAVLVETGGLPRGGDQGLAPTVAAGTNVPALFRSGSGHGADVAWSLVEDGDTVAHARLIPATQSELRAAAATTAQRFVVGLTFLALILVSIGWLRHPGTIGRRPASAAPLVVAAIAATVAPLGAVLGLEARASSLALFLPVPGVSLGDVIALVLAGAALVSTLRGRRYSAYAWRYAVPASALVAALAYWLILRLLVTSTFGSLLAGGNGLWFGLQLAATMLLTVVTVLVLPRRADAASRSAAVQLMLVGALLLAAGLGVFTHLHAYARHAAAPWLALLWAAPVALLAAGTVARSSAGERLLRWTAAGFIAATAVLPQLWGAHTDARLSQAQLELRTFGEGPVPIVQYRLETFGREVVARAAAGEEGLQLLYRSWVASGLAQEPYPLRITMWRSLEPAEELVLGGAEGSDATSPHIRERVEQYGYPGVRVSPVPGMANVSTMMIAPLDPVRTVSVTVEPRSRLERVGVIAAFLGATSTTDAGLTLNLATDAHPAADSVRWYRSTGGWRSEARVKYPDAWYHAHMEVRFTDAGMRLARATLLITCDLAVLVLLFVLGHLARGIRVVHESAVRAFVSSFRARISFALFLFFLVPTALFGLIAYRGLSAVAVESSAAIADRAVQQATEDWWEFTGDLRRLSRRTGSDVLYYLNGELTNTSSPEGLALGVYGAWMGPVQYHALAGGEESTQREEIRLRGQSYLTAYRELRPSGILGVPVALSSGDSATRQGEVAHLMLLAAVLGLLLSAVLSVAVARALAGPIGLLQRAAAAVGAGHLSVRLPQPPSGEFGQLFTSFNRMARRLRRARAQEVRTARVLAWGEMAQQIAHEIKNPLTPIKLAVQHLRRAYRDQRPDFGRVLDDNVDQVLIEIDRLTEISRAFSRYGAPAEQAGPLTSVDVSGVVREAITLYRAGESTVRWNDDVEPELPRGRARTSELREVLMNLLENARDAVADDGAVMVSAHRVDGRIELQVRDDGPGIPADLLPRIFDPHFSTRSSGTGLGLAIVRRLVESWGGSVDVHSQPGEGTSFRVRIPQAGSAN